MSDLASRMAKQVGKDNKPKTFQEAPKKYPHRITLDLSAEDYQALRRRAFEEHIGMASLLRGLVQLYLEDPKLSDRVSKLDGKETTGDEP